MKHGQDVDVAVVLDQISDAIVAMDQNTDVP